MADSADCVSTARPAVTSTPRLAALAAGRADRHPDVEGDALGTRSIGSNATTPLALPLVDGLLCKQFGFVEIL